MRKGLWFKNRCDIWIVETTVVKRIISIIGKLSWWTYCVHFEAIVVKRFVEGIRSHFREEFVVIKVDAYCRIEKNRGGYLKFIESNGLRR